MADKYGIKSEILTLLENVELRAKLEKNIDIKKLRQLIDEYLHHFLDKIKKERIERFFGRYYYGVSEKRKNFKEINENFYSQFNYYNYDKNSGSKKAIPKRPRGINPFYASLLRIILDIIFSLQEKERYAQGEPIYKNLSKLLKVCDEVLDNYLKENTPHKRKMILRAFFFCNNAIPKEKKRKRA